MARWNKHKEGEKPKTRLVRGRSNLPIYINTLLLLGWYGITFKVEIKQFLAWLSQVL